MRSRWVRFECRTATEWFPCFQFVRDAIGAVLGAGKNQSAVVIRPFEQRHEQIEFCSAATG